MSITAFAYFAKRTSLASGGSREANDKECNSCFAHFSVQDLVFYPCLIQNELMCWEWIWGSSMASRRALTSDAMTQTEGKYFQKCQSCDVIFDLSGDSSYAGHCRFCDRQICYMCIAYLWHPGGNSKETRLATSLHDCENAK